METLMAEKQSLPVGRRIKELREAAGITQQQLAVKAGLSVSNLSQIEQGQKADPRISTLYALAVALDVSLDAFVSGSQATEPEPAEFQKPRGRPRKGK